MVDLVEGADDPAQRREWGEGIEGCDGGNPRADGVERRRLEEEQVVEVGYEEGVGGRWDWLRV